MHTELLALTLLFFTAGIAPALPQASEKAAQAQNVNPELNLKALAAPLQDLTSPDKKVVDEAIGLIKEMRDVEAIAALTKLIQNNSGNSSLRVLRAYALLKLGNLTGALDDANVAESAGVPAPYRCWFLAQVAFLSGNAPICHREINHVSHDPTYGPQAEKLKTKLEARSESK